MARGILLLLVWVLMSGAESYAAPVVLVLKNGDRITGEIKSETPERVVVKTSLLGTLKISKTEIAGREPLVVPAPPTAATPPAAKSAPVPAVPVLGKPAPSKAAASPGYQQKAAVLVTNQPPAVIASGVRAWLPDWLLPYTTNWHGNVQLGMDLGFGTADRETFYANALANHSYNRVRNTAEYHVAYGTLNGRDSANRMNGRVKTDYDFGTKRKTYAYLTGGAGYDEIRRVDLEFDEGAGIGYKILQRPNLNLNGELGAQYQNIDFNTALDRSYLSIRFAETLNWKVSSKLNVTQRMTFLPNMENVSDYRVRLELSASYPLFKRVTVSFNAIEMFDSAPPAGVDKNDLTLQSTLGITF